MASRKKQEDKHLKILRELVTLPHNKKCFDCAQRGPTYVNMTIGAFVCTSCSGLLRGMNPPHRIKSISMATFNPQEIEFLQSHGNEVSAQTWLALWESKSEPIPESREEQRVKDFLARKYERKLWYSTRPKINIAPQEPEAKPLKTLLGENAPQVVVAFHQEQKLANSNLHISPPGSIATSISKPSQPVAAPPQGNKSNMDLLGDLGSDPFGAAQQNQQNAFGMFQQPPPAQNQQQPLFNAFDTSTTQQTQSFDIFANSTQQPQQPMSNANQFQNLANSSASTDFFSSNSSGSVQQHSGDKYAAFTELDLFKSSTTQSVFSGTSVTDSKQNPAGFNILSNTQPNPFMSPSTQSSGVATFQQQQQKPANPFQNQSTSGVSQPFGSQALSNGQQAYSANTSNQFPTSNWGNGGSNFSTMNNAQPFPVQGATQSSGNQMFGTSPQQSFGASTQQPFSNSASQQSFSGPNPQLFGIPNPPQQQFTNNQFPRPNNPTSFASSQLNAFGQNTFPPQQSGFGTQQPINPTSSSMFQQSASFNPTPQQQLNQFSMQQNFPPQQNQANFNTNFNAQPSPASKPFGGVAIPGIGQQFPPQQQQQQPFGSWGQPQQQQQRSSNNPFM